MQLFLISGLSGSGKSIALKALEDSGFYCIDNLPAAFLLECCGYLMQTGYRYIAISIDVRSADGVQRLPELVQQLRQRHQNLHLLFLEAHNEVLVKRFSETRRKHPLSSLLMPQQTQADFATQHTLKECVIREREMMADIAGMAQRIDTSDLKSASLRACIKQFVQLDQSRLLLQFQSFGFKYGIPLDADFVFDVRCLPNPHYVPELKPLTGKDQPVQEFLAAEPEVKQMEQEISDLVRRWLPRFLQDNRGYLTVAIGCTGGQHRSVYLTEQLGRAFDQLPQSVLVRHRQLDHDL